MYIYEILKNNTDVEHTMTQKQIQEMLEKLRTLSNKYFKFNIGNIQSYEFADRQIDQNIFLAIQNIDEAINENKQVKFKYVEYGIDKKLHPRTDSKGKPREYIINPYAMVAIAGRYYVLCNNDKFDDIANYRIDRIIDVGKLYDICQ